MRLEHGWRTWQTYLLSPVSTSESLWFEGCVERVERVALQVEAQKLGDEKSV